VPEDDRDPEVVEAEQLGIGIDIERHDLHAGGLEGGLGLIAEVAALARHQLNPQSQAEPSV